MKSINRIILVLALLIVSGVYASAATFHVRPDGSDAGDCSRTIPCRTIARGVSVAVSGDTVLVHSGVYRERIRVTQSGHAGAPLTITGQGHVEMDGFRVEGNWIVIQGFSIDHGCLAGAPEPTTCRYNRDSASSDVYGFWVTGNDVTIRDSFVTGTYWGGVSSSGARNRILNNRFIRTGHPALLILHNGGHNLVEGNEIADVIPYAGDQDGIRLFGVGHIIRNNYIHDIYSRRGGPHRDAMQTFDTLPEHSLIDVLIEGNIIVNTFNGGMFSSSQHRISRNVIWRNNVFMNGIGHMVQAGIKDFLFEGNVFYLVAGQGIHVPTTLTGRLQSNKFLWVRGTYPTMPGVVGSNNWAYPSPTRATDPVRSEPGGIVGVRPRMPNLPLAVFSTVANGTGSTLYLAPVDSQQLKVGSVIEIDVDGFARTVTALDGSTGRVDFSPAISGQMARVPGSSLPMDYGQWRIAATDRFVALWSSSNVKPDFSLPNNGLRAPTNLRIVPKGPQ